MVEKKNGVVPVSKKVAASVLAGIMATGMVPAAAFAEGTATDTSSDSNVELQAEDVEPQADDAELQSLSPSQLFSKAEISLYDKDGNPLSTTNIPLGSLPTDDMGYIKVPIDGNPDHDMRLKKDTETGRYYDEVAYIKGNKKKKNLFFTVTYKNSADLSVDEDTVKNNSGEYKLVVTAIDGAYKGGTAAHPFSVAGTAINVDDTQAWNKEDNSTTFTYNAAPQKIVFKTTGGVALTDSQYVVQYFKEGADLADPSQALPTPPVDAGVYYAKLSPRDGVTFKAQPIKITVDKLDLSSITELGAQFSTSVVVGADTPINSKVQLVSVNGSTALASKLQVVDWRKDDGPAGKDLGAYSAKLTAKDPNDKNFDRGTDGEIKYNFTQNHVYRVAHATSMEYNGNPMDGQKVNIITSLGQNWDPNLIRARNEDGIATQITAANGKVYYTSVTEQKQVTGIVSNKGDYIVTALWHGTDYEYGAGATMSVTVTDNSVDADTNAIVTFQEKEGAQPVVTNAIKTIYDGTDITKRIGYSIKHKDAAHPSGYLEEGPDKDYTVDFTDSKGNVVTSIKDAGSYTLTFKSKKFYIKNPSVPITVEPAKIQAIMPFRNVRIYKGDPQFDESKPASEPQYKDQPIADDSIGNGQSSVIVGPEDVFIRYNDGEKNTNGDLVWKDLPADAVVKITNSKGEEVKKFDKADTYKISVSKPSASGTNMEITAPEMTITATDRVNPADFLDVINPKNYTGSDPLPWYCKEVYKAKELGYVHGHSGDSSHPDQATLFKPEDNLTRAQFAQILLNMAGTRANETVKGLEHDEKGTFRTDFSDCDDSAWYAKAVAWAHATKIVQGYGDTGEYKPDQSISRQEVATMLSRYEKYVAPAQYKSGEGTSLSSYLDSFAVDGWAESSVKWAVANKVMGVGTNLLNPRNDITRAEVAAMAVRAQPNKLAGA